MNFSVSALVREILSRPQDSHKRKRHRDEGTLHSEFMEVLPAGAS